MKKQITHEIESTSIALQVILCLTCIMTLIGEFFAIKDLISEITKGVYLEESIAYVICNVFFLLIQLILIKVFRTILKEGTPFIRCVSKCIKIIGGLIMFASPLSHWIGGIIAFITSDGGEFTIINTSMTLGLILGLIFACLGSIFDYGCQLQQLDDETL